MCSKRERANTPVSGACLFKRPSLATRRSDYGEFHATSNFPADNRIRSMYKTLEKSGNNVDDWKKVSDVSSSVIKERMEVHSPARC